jgi:hypothetical protein
MALAVREVERQLTTAKESVRAISREVRGLDRAATVAAVLVLAFALLILKLAEKRENGTETADPVLRLHAEAPEDDEPVTVEDAAAVGEGLADVEQGNVRPLGESDQPVRRGKVAG